MARAIPRRTALRQIGLAGAGVMLSGGVFRGQSAPITIAGRPVEIAIASVTPSTVRITVLPLDGTPVPEDGALVPAAAGRPAGRAPAAERFAPIEQPVVISDGLDRLQFVVENRSGGAHETGLWIAGLPDGNYELSVDGRKAGSLAGGRKRTQVALPISASAATRIAITKIR